MTENGNERNSELDTTKKLEFELNRPTSFSDPFLTIHRHHKDKDNQMITQSYALGICHRIPERSIHFRGKPIICYRCAGTYLTFGGLLLYQIIGIIIGFQLLLGPVRSWFLSLTGPSILIQILVVIILQLPMLVDGSYQAKNSDYSSTNPRRLITGMLSGLGYFAMILLLGSIYFALLNLFG